MDYTIARIAAILLFANFAQAVAEASGKAKGEVPELGLIGDPRVNVLKLNLALDQIAPLTK